MQPIQGLQNAFGAEPGADPLGIAVQARARARHVAEMNANPMSHLLGPLPDPQWEGFFQAADENGVGRITGGGGLPNQPYIAPSPEGPFGAFGAGTNGIESQAPSNPFRLTEPSAPVVGLQKAAPQKKQAGR